MVTMVSKKFPLKDFAYYACPCGAAFPPTEEGRTIAEMVTMLNEMPQTPFTLELINALDDAYKKHQTNKANSWLTIDEDTLRKELFIHIYKWKQWREGVEQHDLEGIIGLAAMLWNRLNTRKEVKA